MAQIPQLGASLLGLKFSHQFQEREENQVFFLLALWLVLLASPQDGPAQGRWRLQYQALLPAGLLTARARLSREYGLHSVWQCPKRRQERMQPPHRHPLQHHSSRLPFLVGSIVLRVCAVTLAAATPWMNPSYAHVPVFVSRFGTQVVHAFWCLQVGLFGQSPALCSPLREAN